MKLQTACDLIIIIIIVREMALPELRCKWLCMPKSPANVS